MEQVNNLISSNNKTDLKHAFMDACADKEFKDFVYGLKIKEEVLIKYTSLLEDAFVEYKNCLNCKGLGSCKNKVIGFKETPIENNNIINFEYIPCERKIKEDKKNKFSENITLFEMNKNIKEASLKEVFKDDKLRLPIIKFFKEFIDNYDKKEKPKGLYLYGSFGSGKTYLIAALFNEMARRGVKSALVYYPELLRNLKSSFKTNYEEKFDYIRKAPLLLLDDIGAENETPWSRDEILSPLLQYRMEENLPTFFTSNLTLEELEKQLSITSSGIDSLKARRIIERIKQLTVNEKLVSKNRRV